MGTIYCSNCGAKNTKESSFCSECGEMIILQKNEAFKCNSCGYDAEEDEKYCPECGASLNTNSLEKEIKKEIKKQPPIKKTISASKTPVVAGNKKKGGCRSKLGKGVLWLFGMLVVGATILYFINDDSDGSYADDEWQQQESVQNISEEEMKLPPVTVRKSNAKLIETSTYPVSPTNKQKEISYTDEITISLPTNFTSEDQILSVSKASVDTSILIEDAVPLQLIDLALNDGKQPRKPIEISYAYDQNTLNPDLTPEEQLEAYRWDDEGGGWVSLPILIDENNHTVSTVVDHFCVTGFFIRKYIEENILNNIYMTPEKNFKILYSESAILSDPDLNTSTWKSAPNGRTSANKSTAPAYIQAVGYILEEALKSYTTVHHFKNPAGKHKGFLGSYQKTITVKIDSWFSSTLALGNASYEKIYERLHIPTVQTFIYSTAKITLAHELFHRMQAEYYGVLGMYRKANLWWLEATAEYASYAAAWPTKLPGLSNACGNNYLTFPITDKGVKKNLGYGWTNREYQYVTAIWINFLIENGSNLKNMVVNDAADYKMPIYSLENYLYETHKRSIHEFYRSFSHQMVFSPKGHLSKYPIITSGPDDDRDIAIKNSTLVLGDKKEISYDFKLPKNFTSHLWGIRLEKNKTKKSIKKSPVIVEVKNKSTGTTIDVFLLKKMEKYIDPPKPIRTFYTGNQSKIIMVGEGEVLCIVATQGHFTNGNVVVVVRDAPVQLEIKPSELLDATSSRPYAFEFKATDIPKEVKKVKFEWNFSDGSKKSIGLKSGVAVVSEAAEIEIVHQYEKADQEENYPLKVVLKDDNTGIILAAAQASITLPLEGPKVFITERHVIGPPGATFDLVAKASPENTYKFVWTVEGLSEGFTQTAKESGIAPVIDKIGQYSVTVKLYDLDNKFLSTDKVTIYVEEQSNNFDNIALVLTGSVELLWIPDDGTKGSYTLGNNTIYFNNEGKYEVNGATYQSNISINKNNIIGKSILPKSSGETQELILFFDNLNSKKLSGFQYKKNIRLEDQSTKTNISATNIPFKMTENISVDGKKTIYEYRFKGNVTPYITSCEMEYLSTNRNETTGSKWGKYDPNWEIYIRVTYK